jgi:class 3 adenylate cyclase
MDVKFHNSIALKMTLLVLGGTSIVCSLVLAYSYYSSKKIILNEVEKNARNLTLSVARRIEQEFRAVEKVPLGTACFLETTKWDKESLLRVLKRSVLDSPELYGSTVAFEPYCFSESVEAYAPYYCKSKDGLEFFELAPPSYNYFQFDWYHIPRELKAPVWSEPYFDEGAGNILMATYSVPFFQRDGRNSPGRFMGIVTADVSLEWLTKLLFSIHAGRTGYCFLVSGDGAFISHPDPNLIMRESLFSIAEESGKPHLRRIFKDMLWDRSGFVDLGVDLKGEDAFLAYARIPSTRWSLGTVFLKNEIFAEVEKLFRITILLAAVGILLLLAVSILTARSIARPLRKMAGVAGKVAAGDLDVDLSDIKSRDEVGLLAQAFTRMTHGLKERDFIRNTFGRYLTREVVNRLLESKDGLQLGGEARNISIIMSDVRGFTALTATMAPEKVISFLNRYLGKMVDILIEYRGTIDEIIGDGILAFFGAPESMEDHPARAVACALKMQTAMDELNALNEADGFPRLEMGIAVNTGNVVVGNIGSERRTKYGAVGSQVNFTGRMESFTVGGQVLISQSTYERLSDVLDIRKVLAVEMKGLQGTVNLYDVQAIKGAHNIRLPDRDETPVELRNKIDVKINRLDKKTVSKTDAAAWFTHVALNSAVLVSGLRVKQWEDLKITMLNDDLSPVGGEIYAKVVSVSEAQDSCEAVVHFTSVPAEAYKIIRQRFSG